jgi:hypothetical protein
MALLVTTLRAKGYFGKRAYGLRRALAQRWGRSQTSTDRYLYGGARLPLPLLHDVLQLLNALGVKTGWQHVDVDSGIAEPPRDFLRRLKGAKDARPEARAETSTATG